MEITPMPTPFSSAALAYLQASFLASVLPRVLSYGRVYFRDIKCPHYQEDAIGEMIGLAWEWHLHLAEKGQDATCFPTTLACYAARTVQSGRRLCDQKRTTNGLSPLAQQGRHFAVGKLPDGTTRWDDPASQTLHDNTTSTPEETLCFQRDLAAWLANLTERDGGIAENRMAGKRTLDGADKFGVTPAGIAQRRREFCQDWRAFCDQLSALAASSVHGVP
jgi:hypothetical protein